MIKLIMTAAACTVILAIIFYSQIAAAVVVVGYTLAAVIALAGIIGLVFGGWYLSERLKLLRASRIQAEKQAHVMIVTDNGESWVRDTDSHSVWRNLTATPALYVNGQQANPQPWEVELYRLRLLALAGGKHQPASAALLPETVEVPPLDLMDVFTQPGQAYAIIGGQQTGKTYQARNIANYWLKQGLRPVVVGPKWDLGEWGGCYLLGGSGDFEAVGRGIAVIRKLAETRHADPRPHKAHAIQPVFFDDWTPIVDQVDNARALILEATTLYSSVNILLYFILHSDTGNAWGVDKKGAALKDNFVKLVIVPAYDSAGLVVRSQTKGYIRFAGESVDRPTRLFTAAPANLGQPWPLSFPADDDQARPAANPNEAAIIELHEAGASLNQIARQIYGTTGGKQTQLIKAVLANN